MKLNLILAYCGVCRERHVRLMLICSDDLVTTLVNRLARNPAFSALVITEL